jgi:Na+-transporting methylmalonyl-CoA/oxaloacetate decarboxylase gamma subunit
MSNQKKILCLALLLLSSIWIFYSGRQAILLVLLVILAAIVYAMARALRFFFVSESAHAKVIRVRAVERPDSDGYSNWTYYMTFQLTLASREYVSTEIANQIRLDVGDMVKLRYRRTDPQDMHHDYWSTLWWFAILLVVLTASIYMTWYWPWRSHG